jgi:hypothetical protein
LAFADHHLTQGRSLNAGKNLPGGEKKNVGFSDYPFEGMLLNESTDGTRRLADGNGKQVILIKGAGFPTIIYDYKSNPLPEGKVLEMKGNDSLTWVAYRIISIQELMSDARNVIPFTKVNILGAGNITAVANGQAISVRTFGSAQNGSHTVRLLSISGQEIMSTLFSGSIELQVPTTGAYIVQIDALPASKVLVL